MTIRHIPAAFAPSETPPSKVTVGATNELIASAELMRLGYFVYRCESPSAPFDLVAYRDGRCFRVEVKTITISPLDKFAPTFTSPVNDEWDLLAIVGQEADVFLFAAGTPRLEMRNTIRAHFGYPAMPEVRPLRPHGTTAAYSRHFSLKEAPCGPCTEAMREAARSRVTAQNGQLVRADTPDYPESETTP